jgi:hypothetical protein
VIFEHLNGRGFDSTPDYDFLARLLESLCEPGEPDLRTELDAFACMTPIVAPESGVVGGMSDVAGSWAKEEPAPRRATHTDQLLPGEDERSGENGCCLLLEGYWRGSCDQLDDENADGWRIWRSWEIANGSTFCEALGER